MLTEKQYSQEVPPRQERSEELWIQIHNLRGIEQRLENLITRIRGSEPPTNSLPVAEPMPPRSLQSLLTHGAENIDRIGKEIFTRIEEIEELLF